MAVAQSYDPYAICRSIDEYACRLVEANWMNAIPEYIRENIPDLFKSLPSPEMDVETEPNFMSGGTVLRFTLKTGQNLPTFKQDTALELLDKRDPSAAVRAIVKAMLDEYSCWLMREYTAVPDGCLMVWDDEWMPKEKDK